MKRGERITPVNKEHARKIAALAGEGMTSREIAKEVGLSHPRVWRIAQKFGIHMGRARQRRFGFFIADRHAKTIRVLAECAAVSPSTMVERLVRMVVEDGELAATKRLGKLAVPATTYPNAKRHQHERA